MYLTGPIQYLAQQYPDIKTRELPENTLKQASELQGGFQFALWTTLSSTTDIKECRCDSLWRSRVMTVLEKKQN